MEIRLGGGRALTVVLGESDRINVDGTSYAKGTSVTFYEPHGDEVTVFFTTRDAMAKFGKEIVDLCQGEVVR